MIEMNLGQCAGGVQNFGGKPKTICRSVFDVSTSKEASFNQDSNVNGIETQTHDQVIFVSSPSTARHPRNRGDFAPFACVLLLLWTSV